MSFVHNSLVNKLRFHVEFFFIEIRASRTEGNIFILIDINYFGTFDFQWITLMPWGRVKQRLHMLV